MSGAGAGAGAHAHPAFLPGADSSALGVAVPRTERIPEIGVGSWTDLGNPTKRADTVDRLLYVPMAELAYSYPAEERAYADWMSTLEKTVAAEAAYRADPTDANMQAWRDLRAGIRGKNKEYLRLRELDEKARTAIELAASPFRPYGRIQRRVAPDPTPLEANRAMIEQAARIRRRHMMSARRDAEREEGPKFRF
jgi:hypothetical protein